MHTAKKNINAEEVIGAAPVLQEQVSTLQADSVQCRFSAESTIKKESALMSTTLPAATSSFKSNKTDMSDRLKSGLKNLSGFDLSSARVHYNSPKPKQLGALAYAQGTNIHLGAGQEKHLPHEGWHVVQQAQGRVKPTMQMKAGVGDEAVLQGEFAAESPSQLAQPSEVKPNNTGLPDNLKAGVESLSGMSLDNVKVHYNSSEPAQLNAHAYAQGTDIHLGPGQEQHLPHEAWHVVQQAQGRVKPTMQMKDGVGVNDDRGLEREADVMGGRAVQLKRHRAFTGAEYAYGTGSGPRSKIVQCVGGVDDLPERQISISQTYAHIYRAYLAWYTTSNPGVKNFLGRLGYTEVNMEEVGSQAYSKGFLKRIRVFIEPQKGRGGGRSAQKFGVVRDTAMEGIQPTVEALSDGGKVDMTGIAAIPAVAIKGFFIGLMRRKYKKALAASPSRAEIDPDGKYLTLELNLYFYYDKDRVGSVYVGVVSTGLKAKIRGESRSIKYVQEKASVHGETMEVVSGLAPAKREGHHTDIVWIK